MFKHILTILSVIALLSFSACFQRDICPAIAAVEPTAGELESLRTFVEELDEEAVFDERGFYYRIVKPGTANKPGICSDIYATWEGTDGAGLIYYQSGVDNQKRVFDLSNQPLVWRMAFPMIGMDGEIIVYAPPSLRAGYDDSKAPMHAVTIPSDANIVYKLSMIRYN